MDRRTAEPLLLAILATVALAAVAATLPSATESGGAGDGALPGGRGDGGLISTPEPPDSIDGGPSVDPRLVSLVVLAALLAFLYLLARSRDARREFAGILALLGVVVLLSWLLAHLDLPTGGFPGSRGPLLGERAGGSGDPSTSTPPLLSLIVVGVVLLGALAVVLRGGRLSTPGEDDEDQESSAEAIGVGRAARRAADRIETTAEVENEIYRAWGEMTDLLDVPKPDSSTPGEFAAAGVGAGMAPRHVEELTRLFEDVRYGGDEPTEPMEERAVAVLRRIEAAYDPDGGDEA